MYPASTIAYAFVKKAVQEGKPMTQMKLQKLVYFANGLHIALHDGEPLVKEPFQAWTYGPVVPDIYATYRLFGSNNITDSVPLFPILEIPTPNISNLNTAAQEVIDVTWNTLKDVDAIELSKWTHKDGYAWQKSYKESKPSVIIPNSLIQDDFRKFIKVN